MDTLTLTIYGDASAEFNLYEDNGTTEGYKRNEFSFTAFRYNKNFTEATFTIQPDGKQYSGMITERCYEIKLPCSTKPNSVSGNGKNTNWNYDEVARQLSIHLPKEKMEQITVRIN